MSRTDKTRPWWVKLAEHPMVTAKPQHDHRFGPCTLPPAITAETAPIHPRPDRGCHWTVTAAYGDTMHNGCRSCTGYYERREERRRSRHDARRELRAFRDSSALHRGSMDDDLRIP